MDSQGLNPVWRRAVAVGSLWAAAEIIVGSALHNLHLPLAGLFLSAGAVCLLVASYHLRPQPGLFLRAGLVCALMKSVSPSAIILGPMVAILMEALLLETAVRILGARTLGYLLGGVLAVSWSLIHKLASLFLVYGPHLVELYLKLCQYAARQLGLSDPKALPWHLLWGFLGLCLLSGAAAALLGRHLGNLARQIPPPPLPHVSPPEKGLPHRPSSVETLHLGFLAFHFLALILGLWFLERLPLPLAGLMVSLYALLVFWRYRTSLRHLKRPGFWLLLLSLTLLSGLLLGGVEAQEASWSWQGARLGLGMSLRALLMVLGFGALGVELRHPRLKDWFEDHGLSSLSQALPLAFEALPLMTACLAEARHEVLSRPLYTLARLVRQVDLYGDLLEQEKNSRFLFVTGERGKGKTSSLEMVVSSLRQRGLKVGGVLSPGYWREGQREGFEVVDLLTGERAPLCHRERGDFQAGFGPFWFWKKGIELGLSALSPARLADVDVIIVDEVGPLELRGRGFARALDLLKDLPQVQVWVVREDLIPEVSGHWGLKNVRVYRVKGPNDAGLLKEVLALLEHY